MTLLSRLQEEQLADLVKKAGRKLLEYWPGAADTSLELGVQKKTDGSSVTAADFASNEILLAGLKDIVPGDAILSEEVPAGPELASAERIWIIDPLDGTQSFVDGNDDFSVLVALCVNGRADFGMMYFPAREQFASALRGCDAQLNGQALGVSKEPILRKERVYLRHMKDVQTDLAYPRWMDSGCAFLTLCRGEFDGIIIKIVSHREWDLAAPAVVIEESGGRVSDEHGRPIDFSSAIKSSGVMNYKYFVASNGRAHDELLALIK